MEERYDSKKYFCTNNTVKETLEIYGVAVIPSLLDEKECEHLASGMWDFLEQITQKFETPMKRNDPTTYKSFYLLYPLHSMLIQRWGVGQAQFQWDLRSNPKCIKVFENIWGTPNIAVSFDAASFHLPPEKTGKGFLERVRQQWLHTDQSYTRNDFECAQSWMSAFDVNVGDATLTFLEGSHKFHRDFAQHYNVTDKKDWYKLTQEQIDFYTDKGCVQKSISCPKGSLVLWDSRTIHSGQEAMQARKEENIRFVAYLCYTPKDKIPLKVMEKRRNAVNNLRTTSHWPNKSKLFPVYPQTYGNPLPNVTPITPPILNDIAQQLIN